MTREEAIEELKCYHREDGTVPEEIPLAISALEQMPCEDTISRDAVIDAIERVRNNHAYDEIEEIQKLPSVTPSRHKGRWILDEDKSLLFNIYKCSNCENIGARKSKFCPNCGEEMESEE